MFKFDIIIDNSEFYDFYLSNHVDEYNLDIILDESELYDFTLDKTSIGFDIILDYSETIDFSLSNDDIDLNKLLLIKQLHINDPDFIIPFNSEFGFLLSDDLLYIETSDGGFLQYH